MSERISYSEAVREAAESHENTGCIDSTRPVEDCDHAKCRRVRQQAAALRALAGLVEECEATNVTELDPLGNDRPKFWGAIVNARKLLSSLAAGFDPTQEGK